MGSRVIRLMEWPGVSTYWWLDTDWHCQTSVSRKEKD